MSNKLKHIISLLTVCALVLSLAMFAIAVEDDEPADPGITDGNVTDSDTDSSVAVESIKFKKSSYSLMKGDTAATVIEVLPSEAVEFTIEYSSSDENVATVDNDGVITAVGKGEAMITAKCGELTCTAKVVVSAVNLSVDQDHTMVNPLTYFSIV